MYESGENYLETILMLHQKQGYVRSIDIANELGFTKPSVSRAMSILKNDGYIVVESSGNIVLTEKGSKKANEVYERCWAAAPLAYASTATTSRKR